MAGIDWTEIKTLDEKPDVRLVVADMDGTLLDGDSRIPQGFWPMLQRLQERGVQFVPASGRQFHTLENMFGEYSEHMSFIAENGNVVSYDGDIVAVHGIGLDVTREVIDRVDAAVKSGKYDIGLVICGLSTAYIQRTDQPFVDECAKYYAKLMEVEDLHDVLDIDTETILKLAVFDFGDAESMAANLLADLRPQYSVVVSGAHWVDIMNPTTDKSQGVTALQKAMGVGPEQTAVFGDYLNDSGMLGCAKWSFAMANAHPDVKAVANYIAPANTDEGVITVVDELVK
ncbi:Cof-type HAD-IIB family hydrolase [Bifidobacterium choloepi]|uniref:HAD family hydrolase n=1 Tax=Bifidobacterium choloepi TaxID=2614131 RepID=A0A6I5N1J7_9BIFI|nr:Cof-type HAD-IIB family hydrolase [Bifidobacterium choloepi]NEG69509.1 HAD family hydrolase [Bifidobacterium choloepi]